MLSLSRLRRSRRHQATRTTPTAVSTAPLTTSVMEDHTVRESSVLFNTTIRLAPVAT